MTFEEFMAQKYAKAAEYSSGVTMEQKDIAREAWETATLAENEACAAIADIYDDQAESDIAEDIAYDIRKRGRK